MKREYTAYNYHPYYYYLRLLKDLLRYELNATEVLTRYISTEQLNTNKTMPGINKVMLLGEIEKNPELVFRNEGLISVRISLITLVTIHQPDGSIKEHEYKHQIVLSNKIAQDAMMSLTQGRIVYIEGKLRTRISTDPSGYKWKRTEVVGNKLALIN